MIQLPITIRMTKNRTGARIVAAVSSANRYRTKVPDAVEIRAAMLRSVFSLMFLFVVTVVVIVSSWW